jgi:hypothetical protein
MRAGRLPNSAEVKMWQLGGACDAALDCLRSASDVHDQRLRYDSDLIVAMDILDTRYTGVIPYCM